jgi:hypothetical protein
MPVMNLNLITDKVQPLPNVIVVKIQQNTTPRKNYLLRNDENCSENQAFH